jgi:hypothetical protein
VYLAFQTYHRHQVHPDYRVWDQFCKGGQPVYPQRPNLIGTSMSKPGSGSIQSGRFAGKMIVVECLMDEAAYPWQGAWYDELVHKVQGRAADDKFRFWLVDHAMHLPPSVGPDDPRPVRTTRIVSYRGVLEQALRDVAAWVEHGIAPPASTAYQVVDGQVLVPPKASERNGVQPTVDLTANGGTRAHVAVGEPVEFAASIEVPLGAGTVVGAEWDFDGSGEYAARESSLDGSASRLNVWAAHEFTEPGTYFPAIRVCSQRQGNMTKPFAQIQNLGRVRVVVE